MLLEGLAGAVARGLSGLLPLSFTNHGSLRVAQVEDEGDEASRAGCRFQSSTSTAVGGAPTLAITQSHFMLAMPVASVKTAFIDAINVSCGAGTPAVGMAVYAAPLGPENVSIPKVNSAGVTIINTNPLSAIGPSAVVTAGGPLSNMSAGNWLPIGVEGPLQMTTTGMAGVDSNDLRGKYCVPPGCALSLNVVAGITATWWVSFVWREYAADME